MTASRAPAIEIIAELGQGFEGRPEQARLLVRASAAAGADAAKMQLVYADELATPDYKHYDLFRSLEMPDEVWTGLASCARDLGISLHLDVFGTRSLALADQLGVQAVKVHGTDVANLDLLNQIARTTIERVLLGSGGAFQHEIEAAIQRLGAKQVVVLLGFQGYPTPNDSNQIARVRLLYDLWLTRHPNVTIGFADHASPKSPLRLALAATALGAGARVFEKHLTLGEVMALEDHEAALNPDRFAQFVRVLRGCADAYGGSSDDANFGMSEAELGYRRMIRRHVVAQRDIPAGSRIEPRDVALKRSASEDHLTDLRQAYGATARRDVACNQPLSATDVSQDEHVT